MRARCCGLFWRSRARRVGSRRRGRFDRTALGILSRAEQAAARVSTLRKSEGPYPSSLLKAARKMPVVAESPAIARWRVLAGLKWPPSEAAHAFTRGIGFKTPLARPQVRGWHRSATSILAPWNQ